MHTKYGMPGMGSYTPAAAMDVLDLDATKIGAMRSAVKTLDQRADDARRRAAMRAQAAILDDARSVDGMVRFDDGKLPWHADRPAIALYDTFAQDTRLSNDVRTAAATASKAVGDIVLAHSESHGFVRLRRRRLPRCRRTDRALRDQQGPARSVGPEGQRNAHRLLQRSRRGKTRSRAARVIDWCRASPSRP